MLLVCKSEIETLVVVSNSRGIGSSNGGVGYSVESARTTRPGAFEQLVFTYHFPTDVGRKKERDLDSIGHQDVDGERGNPTLYRLTCWGYHAADISSSNYEQQQSLFTI